MVRKYHQGDYPPILTDDPHIYDLIHDAYGPGFFLAWIMAAYVVGFSLFDKIDLQHPPRTLHKDLLITLGYPVLVTGHLVHQVICYPGDKAKIFWTDTYSGELGTPTQDLPYALAIRATVKVCIIALAVNLGLIPHLHSFKWRARITAIVSIWISLGLGFATYASGWTTMIIGNAFGVVATGLLLLSCLFLAALPLVLAHYLGTEQMRAFQDASLHRHHMHYVGKLFYALFQGFLILGLLLLFYSLIYMAFHDYLIPESKHTLFEPLQVFVFVLGMANVLLTLREVWKFGEGSIALGPEDHLVSQEKPPHNNELPLWNL